MTQSVLELTPAAEAGFVRDPDSSKSPLAAAAQISVPLFSKAATIFPGGLFAIAALAALRDASAIILPLVLAFILKLLLQPAMRLLQRLHVPRALAALQRYGRQSYLRVFPAWRNI